MAKSRAQVQAASGARLARAGGVILPCALGVLAMIGCARVPHGAPRVILDYGNTGHGPIAADLDALLAANPLAPGTNIRAVELGRSETVSHHLVQVRDGEAPHVHRRHDLTVLMLRGTATLTIEGREQAIAAGDIVFVARDRVHFVRNTGRTPAVALAVFSPPLRGEDSVPADR
jgi:quercetin dioxygenase-like cupin family protein